MSSQPEPEPARDTQVTPDIQVDRVAQLLNLSTKDVIHGVQIFHELESSRRPGQVYHRNPYQARQRSLDLDLIRQTQDPEQMYRIYLNYHRNQRRQQLLRELSRSDLDPEGEAFSSQSDRG
jgi:hypothetical protein